MPPLLKTLSTGAEEAGTERTFKATLCRLGKRSLFFDQKVSASQSESFMLSRYLLICASVLESWLVLRCNLNAL